MEQLSKYLDDLTPEQIRGLEAISSTFSSNPSQEQALKIVQDLNLDVDTIQRKIRQKRADEVKDRVKIGMNEKCPCGSGLKYKKCCLKTRLIV